ncbi:MAG: hypothetical protein EOS27_24520 [Mesorhizobium sp.]|nr:MAG: hypothetical protein EOS27_24520 [Mesorhizobium sp.]
MLERLNEEIRRPHMSCNFPNAESCLRLAADAHNHWTFAVQGRRVRFQLKRLAWKLASIGCGLPEAISLASNSPAMRPSVAPLWLKAT